MGEVKTKNMHAHNKSSKRYILLTVWQYNGHKILLYLGSDAVHFLPIQKTGTCGQSKILFCFFFSPKTYSIKEANESNNQTLFHF